MHGSCRDLCEMMFEGFIFLSRCGFTLMKSKQMIEQYETQR